MLYKYKHAELYTSPGSYGSRNCSKQNAKFSCDACTILNICIGCVIDLNAILISLDPLKTDGTQQIGRKEKSVSIRDADKLYIMKNDLQ